MVNATPFLPRIYYLQPKYSGLPLDCASLLEHCGRMGFDHVLVPSSWATLDEADDVPNPGFQALLQQCAKKQIALLVDLNIASTAPDSVLLDSHPAWFSQHGSADDLPDPRYPVQPLSEPVFRYGEPSVETEIVIYWQQRLKYLIDAGVAGFRCTHLALAPAAVWQQLIDSAKNYRSSVKFLAWTPGCSPEQIAALVSCGFDATFSSGAWWDYHSRWLVEEQSRLSQVAPAIAFPDSPDEPVISRIDGSEDPEVRRRIYLRALHLAAATGNGILVTMGFEFGLDQHRDALSQEAQSLESLKSKAAFDLTEEIVQANNLLRQLGPRFYASRLLLLSGEGASTGILLRLPPGAATLNRDALLIVASADSTAMCSVVERQLQERAMGYICYQQVLPATEQQFSPLHKLELRPLELQLFVARQTKPILQQEMKNEQDIVFAAHTPRIAIEAITPSVDNGKFPVKRIVGESVNIEADVFTDGHDKIAVALLWRTADEETWHEVRMHATGNDRWSASLALTRIGRYEFMVEAWRDAFSTYRDELEKKTAAGLNVSLELEEGRLMVEAAARYAKEHKMAEVADRLQSLAQILQPVTAQDNPDVTGNDAQRIAALLSEPTAETMRQADARPFAVRSTPAMKIDVERMAARFSSWYELFPRSQSGDPNRHGTFDDVIKRLPAIQAMGFDTLYFPPIHPIGRKHRKGRNNSLTAGPDDPGSPYAIGAEEGGHDAIHPELGTLDDFRRLRDEAARYGLELALDFAIQCSPDHPWLKQHPDWFAWRPDGTIRYAENPPKKYQDIVNVDFYAEGAIPDLWIALRDVVLFWVEEGVRVFRVDNPHTKPLPFWEWMIRDIRGRYPDTIFLSEAFTRPKMMYRLAKVGYSQSYTYFTWRHTKAEFTEYMTELTTTNVREFFRPHFFVNTPDINPYFLQRCGRPGFLIRAALATTLSGLWGMYSGFELCEGTPVPGKEEYLDSEKYEIRAWDWQRPGNIIQEISVLNRIRSENPALQSHLGIRFLNASDENILYFIKSTEPLDSGQRFGDNIILVAINLDPFAAHETMIELPLWEFGIPDDGSLELDNLLDGTRLSWHGKVQHLRLDPFVNPYAIWRVRRKGV